jgi:iron complex outermembrane receptor protein
MMTQHKIRYLTSGALCAFVGMFATPAMAQDATDATPSAGAAQPEGAAPASAQPAEDSTEIVVQAQRRSQRLQDVPIAVTALTSEQTTAQGIVSTHELAQAVTGLTITESVGYVQPFIRGIGTTATNLGEQGTAAIYVDGVYMPAINGQFYELANIQSIEVLRGPQGTLFGRNANSGAILIATRAPSLTNLEGSLNVGYGSFNSITAGGYVSAPLGPNVGFSLAGNFENRESWYTQRGQDNAFDNTQRWTLRAALLIQVTPNFSLTVSGDLSNSHDPGLITLQPVGGYQGLVAGGIQPVDGYDFIGNVIDPTLIIRNKGVSARGRLELGQVEFVSTTAYRGFFGRSIRYDSDTTPTPIVQIDQIDRGNMFTQEFQLNSHNSGPLTWVLGAFYMRQEANYDPQSVTAGVNPPTNATVQQVTDALAGFADATLRVGQIELTGGLRYSREEKTISGQRNGVPVITGVNAHWSAWTPRAVLAWHPSRDLMAYASFSRGFKSGTFNASTLSPLPINPETVDAYEVGVKWTVAPRTTLNISAFRYDIQDLQVQALNPVTNLVGLANAANARSQGVDVEFAAQPVPNFNLRLGVSYLDTKFTSFPNAQIFIKNTAFTDGRNISVIRDVTGNENVRSPNWTANLALDYRWEFGNGSSLIPSVNFYYSGKFFWDVGNRLVEPEHLVINASLTYNLPGDHWSVSVWSRNLTDEFRARSFLPTTQTDRRLADEPQVFGIRAGYRF